MDWSCPICTSRHYTRATMSRGGQEYPTQFHVCLGCSAAFIEPALFSAAASVRALYPKEPTMAHERGLERQSIEYRFWEARAKRLNGMIEPTREAVCALMRRGRLDER